MRSRRTFWLTGLAMAALIVSAELNHAQDLGGFLQGALNGANQSGRGGQPSQGWGQNQGGWGGSQNGWGNNQSNNQFGSNWFRTETHRVWDDNENYIDSQETKVNPGAIIGDFLNALPPPSANQSGGQYQHRQYYRPQPQYNYQPQYTTKPATKQQPQAALKANALPPKPPAEAKRNSAVKADPASLALCDHTAQEAQGEAQDEMNDLGSEITGIDPVVAADPAVQNVVGTINDKIANGEEVTPQDFDKLRTALATAALAQGINVNDPLDPKGQAIVAAVDSHAEDIQLFSKIPPLVNSSNNTLGNGMIVFNPNMGPGEVSMLPSGAVMTGDPSVLGMDPSVVPTGTAGPPPEMALVEGTLAHAMGLPVAVGDPVPDSDIDVSQWVETGVLVLNPKANAVGISYAVNNHSFTMEPGHRQQLPAGTAWKIRFNRGPDLGDATYSLSDGAYFFDPGEKGWDLYRSSYKLTIDNSKNRTPFSYVVNNENYTVDSRQSRDHTSDFPIYVSFDRGGGDKPATKTISERELTLAVAVDPQDQLWDLFSPDSVPKVAEKPLPRPPLHTTVTKQLTETKPRPWGLKSE